MEKIPLYVLRDYLKLARIHSAVLTGLTPVCAAIATGLVRSVWHYFELFFIGILFHVYLFVLNEIRDVDIDRTSKNLAGKPLVEGMIEIRNAKLMFLLSAVLIMFFTVFFFSEQSLLLIPVALAAFLLGGLYDMYGKKIPHADYFVASMLFFVALYGGFSVSFDIGFFSYVIASLAFMQMLINNIIAGLKDVDHDFIAEGKSTAIRLGVQMVDEKLVVSKKFTGYVLVLKMFHTFFIFIPFYKGWVPDRSNLSVLIMIIFLVSLSVFFYDTFPQYETI